MSAMVALFGLTLGCSNDSTTNNPLIVGDTTDVGFQFVQDMFGQGDLEGSFEISADISFELLDAQFPGWEGTAQPLRQRQSSALEDSTIIGITNYMYSDGWHIFTFSATILVNLDTALTLSGIDSIRVRANGIDLVQPDSTADELFINAHFEVFAGSIEFFSYSADHSLHLTANFDAINPNLVIEGSLSQDLTAQINEYTGTDSAVSCAISVALSETITNLTFPVDSLGEPADCPSSGSLSASALINVSCSTASGLDTLSINGGWTIQTTVQTSGDFTVTYSDGTSTWTTTVPCVPGDGVMAAIRRPDLPR